MFNVPKLLQNFSENGECCFVGSADGISVIGWEPDKEFDHIESAWSILGDMKVINKKLVSLCTKLTYASTSNLM